MSDIITDKRKYKKGWTGGLPETPCGHGSTMAATKLQREWIPKVVENYGIKTIADVGAGDLNWVQHVKWPEGVSYTAYDLVPRRREVMELDLVAQVPPKADMILCLWVLNHLQRHECIKALQNIKESGSKYLMVTDRERYRVDMPSEYSFVDEFKEVLWLNEKQDTIRLIEL